MSKKSNAVRTDGRIAVQIYIGRIDGKRKYKTVYGATQKEANAKAQEVRARMAKGADVSAENTRFAEYRKLWLEEKLRTVAANSHTSVTGYSNIWSVFDTMPVYKITSAQINAVLESYREHNPNTNKPTSAKTLKNYRYAIKQMLDIAVKNGAVTTNAAEDITIPKGAPKAEREPISEEQQAWIRNTPHRAQTAAMIMLYAGLRRGELFALRWEDIDTEEKTIKINKAIEMDKRVPVLKMQTKTAAGMRTVYIPTVLAEYLKTVRQEQGLVCEKATGDGYMTNSAWNRLWESYMQDLNIKYGEHNREQLYDKYASKEKNPMTIKTFTAHQLRHTYATILYFAGVDVLTAKEQLGHADMQTTLKIYTHLDAKFKKKNIDKLNTYLEP